MRGNLYRDKQKVGDVNKHVSIINYYTLILKITTPRYIISLCNKIDNKSLNCKHISNFTSSSTFN